MPPPEGISDVLLQRLAHPDMMPMPLQYRIAPTLIKRSSTVFKGAPVIARAMAN